MVHTIHRCDEANLCHCYYPEWCPEAYCLACQKKMAKLLSQPTVEPSTYMEVNRPLFTHCSSNRIHCLKCYMPGRYVHSVKRPSESSPSMECECYYRVTQCVIELHLLLVYHSQSSVCGTRKSMNIQCCHYRNERDCIGDSTLCEEWAAGDWETGERGCSSIRGLRLRWRSRK